jgi:DNA polymerase III sliding clamp (beta) subunit (PCNA family)
MKKQTITEQDAKKSPAGGVLVGKRQGQTIIHDKGTQGGYFVGKLHKEGGIKGINKSTGQPIEVQGGEVIITAPAVADQTEREFEGQMLTNREILSKINEKGGGVSLENGGEIYYNGSSYNYGGKTMTDYEIMQSMNDCGCEHEYDNRGNLDLVKESKKGDHTARDLNNYNDLMDVGVDGQVGAETGLFADGGGVGSIKAFKDENGNWSGIYLGYKFKLFNLLEGWSYNIYFYSPVMKKEDIYFSDKDFAPFKTKKMAIISLKNEIEQIKKSNDEFNQKRHFADGGDLKPYDANMEGDSADTIFKEGGQIGSKYLMGDDEVYIGKAEGIAIDDEVCLFYQKDKTIVKCISINQLDRYVNEGKLKLLKNNKNFATGVDVVFEDGWKVTRYRDGKEIYKKEDKNYSHEILRNKRGEVQLSTIVLDSLHGESFNKTYSETIFEYFDSVDDAKKYVKDNYDTMDSKPEKKETQTLSAEVFEWDKVPTNYRNISKVKKVPFTNNPMDKGLDSIISPFLGKDDLKPVGMGINFDKNGITATDFHKLITLPYPNEKYEGIYDINRVKKIKADQPILIDGNYPNYEAIIPKSENFGISYLVDVYKLLQYTKTAMNYANKITRAISFKFGDDDRIGFNGSLLSEVLIASLKLGHEKLYAFISTPSRAMVLSPTKDYEVGSDEVLIIMPVMLTSTYGTITGYGAEDIDYKRSLKAYFDFNDSEIHNADGSVAEFKMQYENNQLVDDNYLALLSKMIKKNRINILEYVKVENGKMTATDLEISLIVKDVNMPNGIYEIVNNAPNITMQPIEDFPSERVFDKNEFTTIGNVFNKDLKEGTKVLKAFEFVTFSEVFEFYLDKLLLSVGKDDLRPIMSGICIKKTAQNEMFLVTTDAHTLCKINITEYCEFNKDSRELEYVLPVKYLKDFVKLADGSLHFKCSMANIFIEADNLEYIARVIDGKYPNYDAVLPRESTKTIVFDHVVMNKCLKSQEMSNLVSKYKGRKDVIFDFFNIGDTLNIKVSEIKSYNVESELIETIELCKIDLNYKEVENYLSLDQSVFLLMPSKDEFKENQYFSFRKEFFDVMLETITDTEVECYFSEPNRAYVFPIDAIDYKKTLPVEKTKQQKLSKKDLEQIVELEDMKEVLESNELQEAIETLEMLIQTAKGKDKKDIKEALEIIKMLNENN